MLGRAPATKRKRVPRKGAQAQPFVQGRYKLLNTLGCLAFARVTRVLARDKGSHRYNRGVHGFERDTRFLSGYTGYATILGIDGLHKLRGTVFFGNTTRCTKGFAVVGPAIVLDTHQRVAGQNGTETADTVPQVGDILFGMITENADRFRSTCPLRMVWWNANGKPLWRFLRLLYEESSTSLSVLRQELRCHAGATDALFALALLILMGNIDRFKQQAAHTLRKASLVLDLGAHAPLEWAWHVGDALQDRVLCDTVARAATELDPQWVAPTPLSATTEMHMRPDHRASRSAHDLEEEYALHVAAVFPQDLWHAGFLASRKQLAQREAAAATAAVMAQPHTFHTPPRSGAVYSPTPSSHRVASPAYDPDASTHHSDPEESRDAFGFRKVGLFSPIVAPQASRAPTATTTATALSQVTYDDV